MKLNFNQKVISFLKQHPDEKFTVRHIVEHVFAEHADVFRKKGERSVSKLIIDLPEGELKDNAVRNSMCAELGRQRWKLIQKQEKNIKSTEDKPLKYYYTEESDSEEVISAEQQSFISGKKDFTYKEADLYPLLAQFLQSEFGIYSKRINEKRSTNSHGSGGNRWLYPDVVAMEDLSSDWEQEVKNCVRHYSGNHTNLWSFEVKLLINRSNIRECFFQTVSNSSWANFAYLVAAEIAGDDVTIKELRMLSSLHGIGFIHLNAANPSESEIIIPAREKPAVDWNAVNRLAAESRDFMEYIKIIRHFYQTGDVRNADWDLEKLSFSD